MPCHQVRAKIIRSHLVAVLAWCGFLSEGRILLSRGDQTRGSKHTDAEVKVVVFALSGKSAKVTVSGCISIDDLSSNVTLRKDLGIDSSVRFIEFIVKDSTTKLDDRAAKIGDLLLLHGIQDKSDSDSAISSLHLQYLLQSYAAFPDRETLETALVSYHTEDENYTATMDQYGPIKYWDVSKVSDLSYLFDKRNLPLLQDFNADIGEWKTYDERDPESGVTDMSMMFCQTTHFSCDLNWDTTKVTTMEAMFSMATEFNGRISFTNTSQVTNMGWMFNGATKFNQPLEFNTEKVADMSLMFNYALAFNQPVEFNTAKVTNMNGMFYHAIKFNQPVEFNTTGVTNMSGMFMRATLFNQALPFNTAKVTNMNSMFEGATSFNQELKWDCSSVKNMKYMFVNAKSLEQRIEFFNIRSELKLIDEDSKLCDGVFAGALRFRGDLLSLHKGIVEVSQIALPCSIFSWCWSCPR